MKKKLIQFKKNKKKLIKRKYKLFTNEYDEVKNAEELENERNY